MRIEYPHLPFLMKGLCGAVLIALCTQLVPLPALGQISAGSLITHFSAKRASAIKAAFSLNPRFPTEGQAVQFMDASSGSPVSWQWDFGDGLTSTEKNPVHVYNNSGFYRIILVTTFNQGSKRANRTITVLPIPATASFSYIPSSPRQGQVVQFTDTSSGNPTSWQWDFGDGSRSAVKNPSHSFSAPGSFVVSLVISSSSGARKTSQTLNVLTDASLSASFTYSPASPIVGQSVQFTDTSTGSPTSWSWDFGEGGPSTSQNPSHTFASAGMKPVKLTAANPSASSSTSRTITVAVNLAASFTYTPASPVAGQAVQFTDTSVGGPTSWSWNFNDGSAPSVVQNPNHAFTTAGSFYAALTIMNSTGQDEYSQIITVAPVSTLLASFIHSPISPVAGQAVQFTDTSAGGPTSWQWSFGDGGASASQNPSHTYQATGVFSVALIVSKNSGSNSTSQTISVTPEATGYFIDVNNPNASDSNPGTESLPWKTITKANQTLSAGDTVNIKTGTYSSYIVPARSGTAASRITYRAYGSDSVIVQNAPYGILLEGKSYITVQGINFYSLDKFMYLQNNANHNIIEYCNFDQGRNIGWSGSRIYGNSSYNWIHSCRFSKYGYYTEDDIGCVLDIGTEESRTDQSRYNLFEDNTVFHGGHHVMGVLSTHNVIRNNYFHNEPWSLGTVASDRGAIMYGDRNLGVSGYFEYSGRNLFEGNKIAYSSDPPDNIGASGMGLANSYNIVRFNEYFHNDRAGISMSLTSSYPSDIIYNKIYNNTFFHNGINTQDPDDHMNSGIGFGIYSGSHIIKYNAIKNNLLYKHRVPFGTYYVNLSDQIFAGNWDGDSQGNPQFLNANEVLGNPMDDSGLPDLRLASNSPCRDVGTFLTTIISVSGSGTTFAVADAGYFMDGWGIPRVEGDEIQIVGTLQKARIISVNYTTNTIEVNTSLNWTQGQGIALAYVGSAPDVGAHEYGALGLIR